MTKAKTDKIGETAQAEEEKDFKGSAVEGKKSPGKKKPDTEDGPVTCEHVIEKLRARKYPI